MLRLHYKRIMAAGAFLGLLVVAAALAAAGVRSAGSAVNGAASARGGGPLASSHLPCSHGGNALRFYSSRAHRRRHGMSSDMHGVLLDLWDDAWHQGRLIFEPTAISTRTVWHPPYTSASTGITQAGRGANLRFDLVFNTSRKKKRLPQGESAAVADRLHLLRIYNGIIAA